MDLLPMLETVAAVEQAGAVSRMLRRFSRIDPMFRRIFICTVGILIVFNALGIILLLVNRRMPMFTASRELNLIFSIGFIVNYFLVGVCLFAIGIKTNALK